MKQGSELVTNLSIFWRTIMYTWIYKVFWYNWFCSHTLFV